VEDQQIKKNAVFYCRFAEFAATSELQQVKRLLKYLLPGCKELPQDGYASVGLFYNGFRSKRRGSIDWRIDGP